MALLGVREVAQPVRLLALWHSGTTYENGPKARAMTRREVTVHIQVTNANGRNCDVRVTRPLMLGSLINEGINVTAAECAALAHHALDVTDEPIHRDMR